MATTTTGTLTAADAASTSSTAGASGVKTLAGAPTAGSTVAAPAADRASVIVTLSGTWAGVVTFERCVDGSSWVAFPLQTVGAAVPPSATANANGSFEGTLGPNVGFRVRMTARTSGSASVALTVGDGDGVSAPASHAAAVTPSDGTDLAVPCRRLWVGGAGTVKLTTIHAETVTYSGVPAGTRLDVRASRVWSTGTSATLILAEW